MGGLWIAAGVFAALVAAAGGVCWACRAADRFLVRLEDRGWVYYRQRPERGGGGGAVFELDRLVRPSVEHVVELETRVEKTADEAGDEE